MKIAMLITLAALGAPGAAPAQGAAPAASAAASMADGEVRKVDPEQAKLTLRHGPIASLDMPGMTMVFKVADPKLLAGLKPGDKVRFTAMRLNGVFTVTAIEPAR
ncbi:MAG: copper-binding protein [Burkholderiales bacterium]|nr:copper-binding protein [Burkholderiales bacterium]